MTTIAQVGEGIRCIDLDFQHAPTVIASYLLEDAGERALIETGPTSTLDTLLARLGEAGVEPESISKVLVTHIHLDHAGASGTFLSRFPKAHLYVHEIGAPHMIDPTRLLTSATRIYGDMMGPLWGPFDPVPVDRLTVLTDGDMVPVGHRRLTTVYTPGHASHHVVFHDSASGLVFMGDLGAIRLPTFHYVRPAAPPPDIELDLWMQSLKRVEALNPSGLLLTHFGAFRDVGAHLDQTRLQLSRWADIVERALQSGQNRQEIVDTVRLMADRELLQVTEDAHVMERYELASPLGMSVDGYLRYFKKRGVPVRG